MAREAGRPRKTGQENQPALDETLDRLVRTIEWSDGNTLAFVRCNHPPQREEARQRLLAQLAGKRVLEVWLDQPIISLLDEITSLWTPEDPPDAVFVYGLEKSINPEPAYSPALGRLNHDRNLLRQAVPVPLLIYLPEFALELTARGAPDFWAWRSGVYEFPTDTNLWRREISAALSAGLFTDMPSMPPEDKLKEVARLEELLASARSLPRQGRREQEIIAAFLRLLGILQLSLGHHDDARESFEESLEISRKLSDQASIAATLESLGLLAYSQGDYETAGKYYDESLEIGRELGDQGNIAATLVHLGILAYGQGHYETARKYYDESLEINRKLGDQAGIAIVLFSLGRLAHDQGNYETTRESFEESLEISRKLGNQVGIATDLFFLGRLAYGQGDYEAARKYYDESLEINRRLGNQVIIAATLDILGALAHSQGDYEAAKKYHDESLEIERTT